MGTKSTDKPRREVSLSRAQIITVAIEMLDAGGESALTFRALAERLATGPGAIYGHVANKGDLVTAACDAVVAGVLESVAPGTSPAAGLRRLAGCLFDAVDEHPWIGAALTRAPGLMPGVRILERVGQNVRALSVPPRKQWATTCAIVSFIMGASQQNAANAQFGQASGLERATMLGDVATAWAALDEKTFPFTRSMASQLPLHDDRKDFLAGVDLLIKGLS